MTATVRIVLLTCCLCHPILFFAQGNAKPVTVTGIGSTYWNAREDCVRQALQQSLSQLVIVDRRISDDKVLRDSIISTMNGFVESFRVVRQSKLDNQVQITADIVVSKSGIENFVLSGGKTNAKIDSNTLLAELARDDLARKARSDVLKRLMDGFPLHAFDADIMEISLDPASRGAILAIVQVSLNRQFAKTLRVGLKAISRPGDYDNHTQDSLSLCLDSQRDDDWVGAGACRTAAVDLAELNQQTIDISGQVYFLVWFSGSTASPIVLDSEYWKNTPYNPSRYLKIRGENALFSSGVYHSAGRNYSSIQISEAARTYAIRIPQNRIPPGSKSINVLPIIVTNSINPRVVMSLFDPTIPLNGPDFEQFVARVLEDNY